VGNVGRLPPVDGVFVASARHITIMLRVHRVTTVELAVSSFVI
jgi:hypothetical protein